MRRLRTRKSLVLFGIAVVLFSAWLPVVSNLYVAILVPLWLVIPAAVAVTLRRRVVHCDAQPVSLLSLLSSRAPPAVLELA